MFIFLLQIFLVAGKRLVLLLTSDDTTESSLFTLKWVVGSKSNYLYFKYYVTFDS